jgi:hypothetical protein
MDINSIRPQHHADAKTLWGKDCTMTPQLFIWDRDDWAFHREPVDI